MSAEKNLRRIYVPPYNNEGEIKEMIEAAERNGFKLPQDMKRERLTDKQHFIILEKIDGEMKIYPKHRNATLSHLKNGDKIYGPESAMRWITEK